MYAGTSSSQACDTWWLCSAHHTQGAAYRIPCSPGHHGEPSPSQDPSSPQVGAIGDEEEWITLYEEENEPDAQMLEIPNLTPYTHYR